MPSCKLHEDGSTRMIRQHGKTSIANFKSNPNQEIFDIRGNAIDTKSSPVINISGEVIYVINQRENYQETNIKLISETITTG